MENLQLKLERLAKESEQELKQMGFGPQMNKRLYYRLSNAKRRLGQCEANKRDINISKWLLEVGSDKDIKNCIIHEILHTFDDTCGHKGMWKVYARRVNSYGIYNITTTTDVDAIMKNNNIPQDKALEMRGKRYEITCLGCGMVMYQNKINSRTLNGFKAGNRYHVPCKSHNFKIVDLQTNEILVNKEEK